MKLLIFCVAFFSVYMHTAGQVIKGRVVKAGTEEPLIYVNIGIVGKDIGTITDDNGSFQLNIAGLSQNANIRFSMIGYESKVYSATALQDNAVVSLEEKPITLNVVEVRPGKQKSIQLGENTSSKKRLTGWGGYGVGAGGERGIKIQSKNFPVQPTEVGVYVAKNAYDSVLFRLHIRTLEADVPAQELLPENIFVSFKQQSGLINIDLTPYNLSLEKPFAVSLEWVKAWGKCKGASCFLQFSVNSTRGTLYTKEASEGQWKKYEKRSPAIFVTCNY